MPHHLDKAPLAEPFTSEEAHRRHEDTVRMQALWEVGREFLAQVVIASVLADEV
jgi:hypothetical protein